MIIPFALKAFGSDLDLTVEGRISTANGRVDLFLSLEGEIERIIWPKPRSSSRADKLWERSCFELFVQEEGATRYWEMNFSPSQEYQCYEFLSYRKRESNLPEFFAPQIKLDRENRAYRVSVSFDRAPWWPRVSRVGVATVLETTLGLSYWALSHNSSQPDFHQADSFGIRL